MAAEAVTHFRFNECEPTWGICSFPQPRGNDPLGKRNTKSTARYVVAIWPPCRSLCQVLKCSGARRSYAAAGRVAIERLRAPFGTTLAIRESGVPAYFVGLAKFV